MTEKRRTGFGRGSLAVILLAAAILLLLYLGWSRFGLGRQQSDSAPQSIAEQPSPATDAAPRPCLLRIESDGRVVAGDRTLAGNELARHCRGAHEVVLDVAGDAPFGAVQDVRRTLEEANLLVREAP